jgi:uncharacterized Zn finger protein (UPF0148 family)
MNKEQVLAIPSLTARQRATAEKLFNSPYYRKNGEINGNQAQVKEFLDKAYERSKMNEERKTKHAEKYGTFSEVEALVKSLVKDKVYSYKAIVDIINKATEDRRQAIEDYKAKMAELETMRKELGI